MHARTGTFRRADRLLRSGEFQHVLRHGRRGAVRGFVVVVAPTAERRSEEPGGGPRLGVTVGRRVGNAVARNRVKRCIREWFRQERPHLTSGVDLVVIARSGVVELARSELYEELRRAAQRAGAWKP